MGRKLKQPGQGTVIVVAETIGAMAAEVPAVVAPAAAAVEAPAAPAVEAPAPAAPVAPTVAVVPDFATIIEIEALRTLLRAALADIELCISRHHHVPDQALLAAMRQKVG
jgi:hypothetical protein